MCPGITQLFVESGMAEAALSISKAYELRGTTKVHEANPMSGMMGLYGIFWLDLEAPEARPIVEELKGMGCACTSP